MRKLFEIVMIAAMAFGITHAQATVKPFHERIIGNEAFPMSSNVVDMRAETALLTAFVFEKPYCPYCK